ncbi:MAG: hypothetical protein ICV86_12360 [Microcoleus sp. T3-bin5]|nr:hypothetical protein [Microcoleus sp. T3-bin5]
MASIDGNGSTKATATALYFPRIPILAPRYIRLEKRGIFRAAIEKASCRAEECFFTDDILINVEAAQKVGINAIQFVSSEQFQKDISKIISHELHE